MMIYFLHILIHLLAKYEQQLEEQRGLIQKATNEHDEKIKTLLGMIWMLLNMSLY